jgi:hypothetical protein
MVLDLLLIGLAITLKPGVRSARHDGVSPMAAGTYDEIGTGADTS